MRRICLYLLSALIMPGLASAAVPVLSGYPSCAYDRVGNVRASDGRRPDGSPDDDRLRLVNYASVFGRLSDQAEKLGANAVVANTHEAAFYTSGGKRSARPVYVSISGGAIRLKDPEKCHAAVMSAAAMQERAFHGDVQQISLDRSQPPTN
ncbi:hypothetical protein [Lysobacter sp. HA18]